MPSPRSRIRHGAMGGARPDRVTLCSSRTSSVLAGNRMAAPHVWLRVDFLSGLSSCTHVSPFRSWAVASGDVTRSNTWTFCYDDYEVLACLDSGGLLREFFFLFVCLFVFGPRGSNLNLNGIYIHILHIEMGSSCLVRNVSLQEQNKKIQ